LYFPIEIINADKEQCFERLHYHNIIALDALTLLAITGSRYGGATEKPEQ